MLQLIFDTPDVLALSPGGSSFGSTTWMIVIGILTLTIVGLTIGTLVRRLRRPDLHGMSRERILETWKQIEHTSDQGLMGAKLSIIEADKLLDGVLKSMMVPGETLGERLKSAGYRYPSLRQVWGAHKLRNQLVHDSSFEITVRQAKQALREYKKALQAVNVL